MDDFMQTNGDLDHIVRLALSGQTDEVRLYVARLARKYRRTNPDLSKKFEKYLQGQSTPRSMMRRVQRHEPMQSLPFDEDSKLSLVKVFHEEPGAITPIFTSTLKTELEQLINERKMADKLLKHGLSPARSAIFTGPPGVGKTLAGRWIAAHLRLPLYILDLTTVMSSLLGKTGSNLRSVLDFARTTPCVLMLDEIDSIAKRRSDGYDVGELKRLVTIILQEIENWTTTSLLLAATNFPEMLDPAIWRRFDAIFDFPLPDEKQVFKAVQYFIGSDSKSVMDTWVPILPKIFKGRSYSEIERDIAKIKRATILGNSTSEKIIQSFIKEHISILNKSEIINLAVYLHGNSALSQREIKDATGLSRDTIRKYVKA